MAVGIVMAVVAVTVIFVLLARMENKNKKAAVADLASDREASKPPDILELVNQEVQETGIGSLPGADGVDPTVLLKVWKRDGTGCAGERGTFVLDEGLAPEEAREDTLRFECGGNPNGESDLQAADPSGATE
jgi:hypothetical protein